MEIFYSEIHLRIVQEWKHKHRFPRTSEHNDSVCADLDVVVFFCRPSIFSLWFKECALTDSASSFIN